MKILNRKSAFTLAEVLVTLGIIGVVSSMTLPTLMKNHQRQVYVTQLHKVYNELSQAGEAQINSRNAVSLSESGINSQASMLNFLKSQFKVVKDCTGTPSDCFASSYSNMNGTAVTAYNNTTAPCITIASGAVICAQYTAPRQCSIGNFVAVNCVNNNMIANLIVDVNGKSGPNIVGRDLFVMGLFNDVAVKSQQVMELALACACRIGQVCDCPEVEIKTNLQKCQGAASITGESDASYCFDQLLNDGWKMEY